MMKNNKSAFPVVVTDRKNLIRPGLTKREYFAAIALQGILANPSNSNPPVEEAIRCADELIRQLQK